MSNRVYVYRVYNSDDQPTVTVDGIDCPPIIAKSAKGADQVARAIGEAIELAGGSAEVRRQNKDGKWMDAWTYGDDPPSVGLSEQRRRTRFWRVGAPRG